MQIDETDRALIAALSEDARAPVADLARRLGLARTTVQARIDRLLARGVIAGFTLRLGAAHRAPIRATALVSIEPRSGAAVLARLKSLPGVETVHTTSGRVDLIVTLRAPSTEALDETLDRIGEAKGVRSSESLVHLSTKIDRSA
ncbi:Lrp/AsnC family transcriptional regulator [Thalassococcus profundi]|uniref:Lrp/AsnC family transcriptional regulator n=1 Tax=Thalassococcus profundi TaxID=2282382 RepID=A0A369TPE4_9RHOB|nr:Lrp/AsnC family transcriptional regulator [Thalassococcus profundi]RDD64816.1 Lrp/AsnC family transcriptional regulator [Thalassococcus profundi]